MESQPVLVLLESYPIRSPAKDFFDLDGRVIAVAGERDGRVTIEKKETFSNHIKQRVGSRMIHLFLWSCTYDIWYESLSD